MDLIGMLQVIRMSDFIWPVRSYMGVILYPKMVFIFPISCILAQFIFPILIKYFPNVKEKVASLNP